jgi:glycosyltransferase involved in cell wall biosynthesis/acetyl esterase/lipase
MTPSRPIRLVILLEDLEFGGTQRYATRLLKHLDRTWFAPEVWVLRGGDDLAAAMRAAGVDIVRFSEGKKVGPRALARLAVRLWRDRPDLLYTLTVIPNVWGRVFAGLLRIPVVSGYRSLLPRQHDRLLRRFSARIIANAAVLKDIMTQRLGIEPDRVAVIPNGVDGEYFSPDEASRSKIPLVVCVARLVGEKDIPTLLEAFRLVRAEIPAARLEIIGNGPGATTAAPNVRFSPGMDDIRPYLRRAWVFALSSRSEASPNVILEAMASGLPVVAPRVGGIPELVEDKRTGLLVPPDDPKALSRALTTVLSDGELQQAMGKAGRERALAGFGVTRMVHETETVLREVAQRGTTWTATVDGSIPPELPLRSEIRDSFPAEKSVERGKFRPDRSLKNVANATLTVYLPPAERASGAAAVICPGGGYAAVTIDKEGHDVARWLTTLGIAGFVLKYRLPPGTTTSDEIPWPLQDIVRALRLMRENAAEWRIDPRRVGAIGFSAGGHMAAFASHVDRDLAFAVLVYPVISMEQNLTHKGSRVRLLGPHPAPGTIERYSFEEHVSAKTPPTLLVHARDDDVVDFENSVHYADALRRAGVPHELLLYERGGHGFALGVQGGAVADWTSRLQEWLRGQGIIICPHE